MRGFRIRRHGGIDESPPHDRRHAIDQRMLDAAVRDVHQPMRAELEHPELGRAEPAPDREPRAQTKPARRAGYHRHSRQSVSTRERLERRARGGGDARLAESRATRARRAMRAGWPECERRSGCHGNLNSRQDPVQHPDRDRSSGTRRTPPTACADRASAQALRRTARPATRSARPARSRPGSRSRSSAAATHGHRSGAPAGIRPSPAARSTGPSSAAVPTALCTGSPHNVMVGTLNVPPPIPIIAEIAPMNAGISAPTTPPGSDWRSTTRSSGSSIFSADEQRDDAEHRREHVAVHACRGQRAGQRADDDRHRPALHDCEVDGVAARVGSRRRDGRRDDRRHRGGDGDVQRDARDRHRPRRAPASSAGTMHDAAADAEQSRHQAARRRRRHDGGDASATSAARLVQHGHVHRGKPQRFYGHWAGRRRPAAASGV